MPKTECQSDQAPGQGLPRKRSHSTTLYYSRSLNKLNKHYPKKSSKVLPDLHEEDHRSVQLQRSKCLRVLHFRDVFPPLEREELSAWLRGSYQTLENWWTKVQRSEIELCHQQFQRWGTDAVVHLLAAPMIQNLLVEE